VISFRSLLLHYSTFSSPIFCRSKGSRRQLSRYRTLPTDRQSAELFFISLQWQETIFCTKATIPAVGWNWPPFSGYRETSRVVMWPWCAFDRLSVFSAASNSKCKHTANCAY
jgi:hypothetical protein